MTYSERDEAYRAGREGRTITHTVYGDAYQQGQRDRKKEKRERDGGGAGGGELILALVLLSVIAALVGIAIVAGIAAFAAGGVLLLASRLPPADAALTYREAYKASFYVVATWLVVTGAIGFGAIAAQTGQPGGLHELVRTVAATFEVSAGLVLAVPISLLPWPDGVIPPSPVFVRDVALKGVLTLAIPAWFAAAIALRINTAHGWLRALITTPFVLAGGVAFGLVALVAFAALAARADTAPLAYGPELAYAALLAGLVTSGAAVVGSLAGGPLIASIAAIVTLGRRFPLGPAMRSTGLAVFVSCLVTALALFLFRDADPLVVAVGATVTMGQLDLPQWSAFKTLLPLAAPGLLWGAAFVRRVMPGSGMLRYLLACVVFAPVGVLFDIAALAAGLAAFDSGYFSSLLR